MKDKLQVLEEVPIFATLGRKLRKILAEEAEFFAVKKGDLVVCENDPGDALFVVVSGRLQAFTRLKSGAERIYARYTGGDCFGEMPLLSGETHWASVRALNDSVLLKIPRENFESVIKRDPGVALGFTQRMGERITQLREEKQRAKWSTIIAIYSAVPGAGKTLLANNLVASLVWETHEPVLLLDFSGRQPGKPLAQIEGLDPSCDILVEKLLAHHPLGYDRLTLDLTGDEKELRMIAPLFGCLIKRYDYVLVDLPNRTCPSMFECLIQSDQIYVVTRNEETHLFKTRMLLHDLKAHRQPVAPKARIVLTAIGKISAPYVEQARQKVEQEIGYLLRWIPENQVVESVDGVPYVLRCPMEPYSLAVRRIARELGNRLVGLALGAGGARGLAHIGVLRVLDREGIAIDVVAGCSMGALIGAAWATGKSADELEAIAMGIKNKRAFLALLDPIFPGAGVIRGIRVYNFIRSIVDDLTFNDTVIPMKIVASDLNTTEEIVFERGKLADAIRASISIPGIFRPVVQDGHTLIDGGVASPVPVDVLARAGVSRIIAVNTIPSYEELKLLRTSKAGPHFEFPWKKRRIHETGPLIETPTTIIKVYNRFMHAMQARIAEDACASADAVIRPVVSDGVWYDFYNPERYIRRGEEAVEAVLPQLRELTKP
jgi:NTE family protein